MFLPICPGLIPPCDLILYWEYLEIKTFICDTEILPPLYPFCHLDTVKDYIATTTHFKSSVPWKCRGPLCACCPADSVPLETEPIKRKFINNKRQHGRWESLSSSNLETKDLKKCLVGHIGKMSPNYSSWLPSVPCFTWAVDWILKFQSKR